jgi:hypothetical protein
MRGLGVLSRLIVLGSLLAAIAYLALHRDLLDPVGGAFFGPIWGMLWSLSAPAPNLPSTCGPPHRWR